MKFFFLSFFFFFLSCASINCIDKLALIDQLQINDLSSSNFIIFSDNHGLALNNQYFARMDSVRIKSKTDFAIGVGDHIKKNQAENFLEFITNNLWWHHHFFPGIADGENEFFGSSAEDWGSGKQLLNYLSFQRASEKKMSSNGTDYYALIQIEHLNIHLIQLHFPDAPSDVNLSFHQSSKDFLVTILQNINKTPNDFIIVGAHSYTGFWHHLLSDHEQKILFQKTDLVVSGATHIFDRNIEHGMNNLPLILNTGSVSMPFLFSSPGFLQVYLLKDKQGILVVFTDLSIPPAKNNLQTRFLITTKGKKRKVISFKNK